MNRRGFLTSALKATAAGILAPEHLWGRSMVQVANVRTYQLAVDMASFENPDFDAMLTMVSLAFGSEKQVFVSPVVLPDYKKAYKHIIKISGYNPPPELARIDE